MVYVPSKWTFEAEVDPNDKSRLRTFIRNEIAYYNGILAGFAPWLRTSPEMFGDLDEAFLGDVAALGVKVSSLKADDLPPLLERYRSKLFDDNGRLIMDERAELLYNAIGNSVSLHPTTRRAMVVEMIKAHRIQAAALSRTRNDQLVAPVTLLQPHDGRVKRHVQLLAKAVVVDNGKAVRTAYNGKPIRLSGTLPADANWGICIIREGEGGQRDRWAVEFRTQPDKADYLLRLTDPPLRRENKAPSQTRLTRHIGTPSPKGIRGRRV